MSIFVRRVRDYAEQCELVVYERSPLSALLGALRVRVVAVIRPVGHGHGAITSIAQTHSRLLTRYEPSRRGFGLRTSKLDLSEWGDWRQATSVLSLGH